MPLNSIDIAHFNRIDVVELLEIADKATAENLVLLGDRSTWGNDLRARFEKIRDRRAKEDADK